MPVAELFGAVATPDQEDLRGDVQTLDRIVKQIVGFTWLRRRSLTKLDLETLPAGGATARGRG